MQGLSKREKAAASAYKKNSFYNFNDNLRHSGNHSEDGIHVRPYKRLSVDRYDHMDRVTSVPLSHPTNLYRGFRSGFPIHDLPVGHEFVDHGYTGTSLDRYQADMTFSHRHFENGESGNHLITSYAHIHAPAGTKGAYLDHPELHEYHGSPESEFTLSRGTRFKVIGHHRYTHPGPYKNITHVVHLDVMGHEPKPLIKNK